VIENRSLLELPQQITAEEASELVNALTGTWAVTTGNAPTDLDADLVICRRWFNPVATGSRLRREFSDLPKAPADLPDLGPPLVLNVSPGRRLVTPEGRCALDLLLKLSGTSETLVISESQLAPYDRILARTYRDWSRHRIDDAINYLAGTNKPLQIPATGLVIALLVDGCTSEERALRRYASEAGSNAVDRTFFKAVNAFADLLAPSRRGKSDQHLIGGWMLYEARRRLGDRLVLHEARAGNDGAVWIREDAQDEVIAMIVRDLARGHRARATPAQFANAFDALVSSLREDLPRLAAFGMAHERPQQTKRLRERLVEALEAHADSSDVADHIAI
jgi:hypothetical protein